jgi:hypothetical protein
MVHGDMHRHASPMQPSCQTRRRFVRGVDRPPQVVLRRHAAQRGSLQCWQIMQSLHACFLGASAAGGTKTIPGSPFALTYGMWSPHAGGPGQCLPVESSRVR